MIRIATMIALATTACLTSPESDLGLDRLPAYQQDTGGGDKSDDANCTDAGYRTVIQAYFRSEAAADANPCKDGNDASYRIWAYVAGQKLEPVIRAYTEAADRRFAGSMTREQTKAAGTLDAATRDTLTLLAAIRPHHAGKIGLGAWRDELYAPAIAAATRPIGDGQPVPDARDQWSFEVTSFEDEWLGWIEQAMPDVTEPQAFAIWWEVTQQLFDDATRLATNSLAEQAAASAAFLERLAATRPSGAFDEDGAAFQDKLTRQMAVAYNALSPNLAKWRSAVTLKPSGGGKLSYKAWAVSFAEIAQVFNASVPSDEKRALFSLVISVRPCASGSEVDELVQRLSTGLAAAGNVSDGTPLSQVAVPTACP
jgi:hypothetical protein